MRTFFLALLATGAAAGGSTREKEKSGGRITRDEDDAHTLTFKAIEWSGAAKKRGSVDPYDGEKMIEFNRDTKEITFPNGGGGGPYKFEGELAFPLALSTPDGEPLTLDMEEEFLTVTFGYPEPATVHYERRGCGCRCSKSDSPVCRRQRKKHAPETLPLEGQTCDKRWTDCHGCFSTAGYCGTPSGALGEEGGFAAKVYCGLENCPVKEDAPDFAVLAPGAATALADLEGAAWVAVSWTGAAEEGGDPDPTWDEQIVQFEGNTISFPNGGGGGPYTVTEDALPLRVQSPDGESIGFRMIPSGHLVVEFAYARAATIVYEKRDWSEMEEESDDDHNAASSSCLLVVGALLVAVFVVGLSVGAYFSKRKRQLAPMSPVLGVALPSKKVSESEPEAATVIVVDDGLEKAAADAIKALEAPSGGVGLAVVKPTHVFTNCTGEPLKRCDLGAACPHKHEAEHAASYYHADAPSLSSSAAAAADALAAAGDTQEIVVEAEKEEFI